MSKKIPVELQHAGPVVETYLKAWRDSPDLTLEQALINCVRALITQNSHLFSLARLTTDPTNKEKIKLLGECAWHEDDLCGYVPGCRTSSVDTQQTSPGLCPFCGKLLVVNEL